MGCASCGNKAGTGGKTPAVRPTKKAKTENADCIFKGGILIVWYNALKCVKDTGKLGLIGITSHQANKHLGIIQSALNQPDNYCLFETQLTDFYTNILPRIIENVPNCL
jgi:hypothetical protein